MQRLGLHTPVLPVQDVLLDPLTVLTSHVASFLRSDISREVITMVLRPPKTTVYDVAFPEPGVMLVTINRPAQMNSIPVNGHYEGHALFEWFDSEPSLAVAIITGAGEKAFCAGADLAQQQKRNSDEGDSQQPQLGPPSGFAGLSRRVGKKPVIAAVAGYALGGGTEICLNWYEHPFRHVRSSQNAVLTTVAT